MDLFSTTQIWRFSPFKILLMYFHLIFLLSNLLSKPQKVLFNVYFHKIRQKYKRSRYVTLSGYMTGYMNSVVGSLLFCERPK